MNFDMDALLLCISGDGPQKHCALALVYAMCALGALMSSDLIVRDMADHYATIAQSIFMQQGTLLPDTNTLQALLCCAFYSAGKGDVSKSWQYSGNYEPT
jgi:hypothetical protein